MAVMGLAASVGRSDRRDARCCEDKLVVLLALNIPSRIWPGMCSDGLFQVMEMLRGERCPPNMRIGFSASVATLMCGDSFSAHLEGELVA